MKIRTYPKLGSDSNQRRTRNLGKLAEERIQKLDEIGLYGTFLNTSGRKITNYEHMSETMAIPPQQASTWTLDFDTTTGQKKR